MGYDFHITRADNWTESESQPITAEEWLAFVDSDSELRIGARGGKYFAEWSGAGTYPDPWFDWSDGQIYTKNPRRRELTKMLQMASLLDAQVQGDDGEIYVSTEDMPSDEEFDGEEFGIANRPWWKFWA